MGGLIFRFLHVVAAAGRRRAGAGLRAERRYLNGFARDDGA
jgi:hypothetical protein